MIMHLIFLVLFALLTKPIIESSLVKGDKGFLKTYFLYGGVITFVFVFFFAALIGNQSLSSEGSGLQLRGITKTILSIISFYYIIIAIGLSNVSRKSRNYFIKLSCQFFIAVLAIAGLVGITFSFPNSAIYLVSLMLINKLVWRWNMLSGIRASRS